MNWFQIKEKSAGKKRLLCSYYLYNIFGSGIIKLIAFCVTLVTFITNKDLREYSYKYFRILYSYTKNPIYKPTVKNQFKHSLNYAFSLVDKMEAFANKFDVKKIKFADKKLEEEIFNNIRDKNGMFFICNHVGNVEMMRSLVSKYNQEKPTSISIFMQKTQCEIFNNFINSISYEVPNLSIYPIEEIDISTACEIEDSLNKGGIVFMAGDRVASNNEKDTSIASILNTHIKLPDGVFKFANMLPTKIYFVSCVKDKNNYIIYIEKQSDKNIDILKDDFIKFLEKMILLTPHQFFNFYDIFIDN